MKEILLTFVQCLFFYALGLATVKVFWPILRRYSSNLLPQYNWPGLLASILAFLLLFVITHMQEGRIDPLGLPFLLLYLFISLGFALSTVHPKQYNVGAASVNMALTYVTLTQIVQKLAA